MSRCERQKIVLSVLEAQWFFCRMSCLAAHCALEHIHIMSIAYNGDRINVKGEHNGIPAPNWDVSRD